MRKLALRSFMFVLFFLFFLLPAQAGAPLPGSLVIHGPEEAVRERGGEILPRLPKGQSWVWGWKPDPEEAVAEAVYRMVYRGVPESLFQGVEVWIFPVPYLPQGVRNVACDALGFTVSAGSDKHEIWLASWKAGETFVHEVGHVIHARLLDAPGYDWSRVNETGREYLKLKGYPAERGLGWQEQVGLPWSERAAEWFAGDFVRWVAGSVEGLPGEVKRFFDRWRAYQAK